MKTIAQHIVPADVPQNQLQIHAIDEPDGSGASHRYRISSPEGEILLELYFQQGPIREAGLNGVTHEALLAILLDRLWRFQAGEFACRENALALAKCQEALMWLQQRTSNRIQRGVEGTNQK